MVNNSPLLLGGDGLYFAEIACLILIWIQYIIFKASALWADAFYKSKCPSVSLSVCLSVCLFTFEVPFNGLFAPTSRSRMSNIFRDLESLGKSNKELVSDLNISVWKWSKIAKKKKFFLADLAYETRWKPRLPMD